MNFSKELHLMITGVFIGMIIIGAIKNINGYVMLTWVGLAVFNLGCYFVVKGNDKNSNT